jgi:hypothetical protein
LPGAQAPFGGQRGFPRSCYRTVTARFSWSLEVAVVGIGLAFGLALLLVVVVQMMNDENRNKLMTVMLLAYGARLIWAAFLADLPIFSYGSGGDSNIYEAYAEVIGQIWNREGVHYVTSAEFGMLGKTTLPPNLFALVIYYGGIDGGRLGSTAIIALSACLTCLNFYRLAMYLGAPRTIAFRVACLYLFMPAFFLYTSDVYKDGLVLFFLMTAFGAAVRLSRKFDPFQVVIGAAACACLYGCRFYLIFVAVAPLFVSFIGIGGTSNVRKFFGIVALAALFIALFGFTNVLEGAQNEAQTAYDAGERSYYSNAQGGSGVVFDDGGKATGAIHWKLLYTLFSPFPWTTGSIALHVGKIEALIWYYFIYRAFIASRRLFTEDRGLLAMFITFLAPTTFMYALIMSNIGLIVRERMGVVAIGMLLGTLSWVKAKNQKEDALEATGITVGSLSSRPVGSAPHRSSRQ